MGVPYVAVDAVGNAVGPLQAGLFEWLLGTFGPFLIPVVLFVGGLVVYGLLVLLQRRADGE